MPDPDFIPSRVPKDCEDSCARCCFDFLAAADMRPADKDLYIREEPEGEAVLKTARPLRDNTRADIVLACWVSAHHMMYVLYCLIHKCRLVQDAFHNETIAREILHSVLKDGLAEFKRHDFYTSGRFEPQPGTPFRIHAAVRTGQAPYKPVLAAALTAAPKQTRRLFIKNARHARARFFVLCVAAAVYESAALDAFLKRHAVFEFTVFFEGERAPACRYTLPFAVCADAVTYFEPDVYTPFG